MTTRASAQQELADLLSQITQQDIRAGHISHRLIFITALVTLLAGVMYADKEVTEEEKQKIKSSIRHFILPSSNIGQLIKPIFSGIKRQRIYKNYGVIEQSSEKLSDPEKILILAFCSKMAAADGSIALEEKQYISKAAELFKFSEQYLDLILNDFRRQDENKETAIEILSLLDPHHFKDLDPAFMKAADSIRNQLSPVASSTALRSHSDTIKYEKLKQFQQSKAQLTKIANELLEIIQKCHEQEILRKDLEDEVRLVLEKAKSQKFRVAVVGEFSQGKSTLLNALLGEEVQPTRAIPCSGIVTVLKHGNRQKVICRYKDGEEDEVPVEKYQELAAISEEAALYNIAEELTKSTIKEIIFEHPGLELCRHQVEIVDSPGLNEHPERTTITHQLLQNTDAVIFLANASRPFTQGEMELLKSLRQQLQGSDSNQPVENLFVLVNFMDLLRRDKDREHVKQRANNFLQGESPIISGKNRLHFISAQAALDAMLENRDDEYLQSFSEFSTAIQIFLTEERGWLTMRQTIASLEKLVQEARAGLQQTMGLLEGQISFSASEQCQIVDQMGAASGREVKLRLLRDEIVDAALEAISEAWEQWLEGIEERISEKSTDWSSTEEEKEKILRDFANQFLHDLSADLDSWLEKTVKGEILLPELSKFEQEISKNLNLIYENLRSIDLISGSNLSEQFNLSLSHFGINIKFDSALDPSSIDDEDGIFGLFKVMGGGGILGGGISGGLAFLGVSFLPLLLAGLATGAVVGWLFGSDPGKIILQMKQEVYDKGFEKFSDSVEELGIKIGEGAIQAIDSRYEKAAKAIQCSIGILNEILLKHEKIHQETVSCHNSKKELIQLKVLELANIESSLQSLLLTAN
ncbi:dynamin family protein [Leptolyngbya iicbica]|uniref:Dynamin family protein n=2 Tax=Cyanophyceae TaxID=3028117 RepID=A0A4Q7EGC1_9CYAN|nr:dynamin family protein [Leptolyngbya sp. LK]RZM82641.1 dynamin family protein [Leptolyngbya sp. LK]